MYMIGFKASLGIYLSNRCDIGIELLKYYK